MRFGKVTTNIRSDESLGSLNIERDYQDKLIESPLKKVMFGGNNQLRLKSSEKQGSRNSPMIRDGSSRDFIKIQRQTGWEPNLNRAYEVDSTLLTDSIALESSIAVAPNLGQKNRDIRDVANRHRT